MPGGTNSGPPLKGWLAWISPGGPASRLSGQPPPESHDLDYAVGPPPSSGPTSRPRLEAFVKGRFRQAWSALWTVLARARRAGEIVGVSVRRRRPDGTNLVEVLQMASDHLGHVLVLNVKVVRIRPADDVGDLVDLLEERRQRDVLSPVGHVRRL